MPTNQIILIGLIVLVIFIIYNMTSSKEYMTNDDDLTYQYVMSMPYNQENNILNPKVFMHSSEENPNHLQGIMYSDQDLQGNMNSNQDLQGIMYSDQDLQGNMFSDQALQNNMDKNQESIMTNSEDKLYGSLYGQLLSGNMNAPNQEGSMPNRKGNLYKQELQLDMNNNREGTMPSAEEKLYGSLYGQALQGNMNAQNQEGRMPNAEEKLYGSLYGQALQGNMNAQNQENTMPNAEEKLYGSLYGQSLQENINMPMPMYDEMDNEFDKPMELQMDMPINFNNSTDKVYIINNGEDIVKENMWEFNDNSSGNYHYLVGSNINNIKSELDKLRSSGKNVRILFPGSMATMDVRMDRINISVGHDNIVKSVYMG